MRLFHPVVDEWTRLERSILGPHPPPPRALLAARQVIRNRPLERPVARKPVPHERGPSAPRRPRRALDAAARETAERGSRPRPHRHRARLRLGVSARRVATARGCPRRPAARARRRDPHAAAASTSFRRPTWCSQTSSHASCCGSRATASRLATPMRSVGIATGPESSSWTGRSTGRSRGPRRNAVVPRPFTRRELRGAGRIGARSVGGPPPRSAVRPARAAVALRRLARTAREAHGVGVLPRAERVDART